MEVSISAEKIGFVDGLSLLCNTWMYDGGGFPVYIYLDKKRGEK